jgi:hypothetical protein
MAHKVFGAKFPTPVLPALAGRLCRRRVTDLVKLIALHR